MRPNMKTRFVLVLVVVFSGFSIRLVAAPPKKGAARPHVGPAPTDTQHPNLASQRINALETLYDMQATREQMVAMQKIAAETADPPHERKPVQITPELQHIMQELHDALVAANNQDKIESLEDKFDDLVGAQKVEFDDDVVITQAAWRRAPECVRLLSVSQVASLVSANEDDIQDPRARLAETLTDGRKQTGSDWTDARDSAAEEAAILMEGNTRTDELIEKFKHWLDQVHDMDDATFKQKLADPLRSAGAVTGEVDWSHVMRNWVQYCIADLLSNPQLSKALNERLK
jgi:hypothetical protein